ncbi:MAG: hypothetical protein AABX23_04010 [Nanoarchaeota archaeon]
MSKVSIVYFNFDSNSLTISPEGRLSLPVDVRRRVSYELEPTPRYERNDHREEVKLVSQVSRGLRTLSRFG